MIRIRRLPKRRFRRPSYEVEYRPAATDEGWRKVTPFPVFEIEQVIGTGDAWALVNAADAEWDGSVGHWVTIFEPGEGP